MKLNYRLTILIGFGFMSILAFWQFYDQVIPYMLEYTFKLGTFSANTIMSIDNVLAIFMLPLFGALSDKTRTPLGKRTPYVLIGTIFAVILMMFLSFFQRRIMFWGFFITLFLLLVVMATYRTPAVAYMPDVTPKPMRSKANAIINLVGYIGGIFATVVMMLLLKSRKSDSGEVIYYESSFFPVFVVISVFMLLSVLVMVFTVKENKVVAAANIQDDTQQTVKINGKIRPDVLKSLILILISVFLWFMSYNAVTTAFSRYCVQVWKTDLSVSSSYLLVATISAIIAFVPLGFISSRLGRKKSVLLGIVLMTVCYFIAIFIRHQTPIMYAIFGLVGIGWASINVNSFPMVVEMSTGSDIGKYTGYYYTFSMAAQITTPLLSGFLIEKAGLGYNILFPYAVFFSIFSFITMLFVKHGDCKPEMKGAAFEALTSEVD
ncbi:MAG: MFS transporter [Clostridia bacterium]|nr:MFS transporter [Clostridia bacterium]MBP3706013.1 MFS transporter [Clostridia bacterium]